MKYIFIVIFILAQSFSFANKPFSTWQIDDHFRVNFDEKACFYDFSQDTTVKQTSYRHTNVLTDESGSTLFSFDSYAQKIVVRDINNVSVGEVAFPEIGDRYNRLSSILLPFYDQQKCFFTFLIGTNTSTSGQLYYFELDYSVSPAIIKPINSIPSTELYLDVLAATINKNKDGYFIGVCNDNKQEIFVISLKSDGAVVTKSYQLDSDYISDIRSKKQLEFSPQGDKLIANINTNQFNFFIFDNSSGDADFKFYIEMLKETGLNIRGALVFSQNGEKMYSQSGHDNYMIHQFDLKNYNKAAVINSRYDIVSLEVNCVDCLFVDFRLAPNNRIYISYKTSYIVEYLGRKDSTYLGVIKCPNASGPFIDFELLGLATSAYVFPSPYIPKIPSNFLATPLSPAIFNRPDDIQQYCINSSVTIKGADDPCGEHHWVKADGSRDYSNDLVFENISAADAGYYFYHFQSCYKQFNDTFEIRIIDKITPEIVKVSPSELDLCLTPLEDMTFTSAEKYKEYKWYFTKSGTTNRIIIGSQDTVVVADLGLLELEVVDEGGCEGIDIYTIEIAQLDYPQIEEYEIRICRGIEQSYSIDFPIKSNKSLRIDSLSLRLGNKMSIINKPFIIDSYPNGEFYRDILIDFDRLNVGILMDTLDIYIDSECKRKISIPLKIIIESTIFTLEVPHLRTVIGRRNFEIPIFLTTTCIEATDDFKFEASIVLSNSKYLVDRVEGVELIDISLVNDNQKIKISYEGTAISNGRNQIGSLFGTVLLTDMDSTGILIQDTVSNYVFDIINGSLITEEICAQDIRQVLFFNNQTDISNNGKSIYLNSHGGYRGNLYLRITNYTGHTVAEYIINKDDETIERNWELTGISSGLYFLQIMGGNRVEVNKLFIE